MAVKPRRDPYGASLAITLFFFYGISAGLAWLAYRWPLRFGVGLLLFFLLIYGKLAPLLRPLQNLGTGPTERR